MNLETWLALLEKRHPQSIDLGLQRCGEVYQRLGSPRPAKMVYTVAGTNGKGSTVAYLAAMSGALGQSYGTYTSPHIFEFNERISIMGEAVSNETLVDAFEQVEAARGDISLTYFEFTTLAGFVILQQQKLDCAVLEVGLGGRLDTVNLVDADCVVITPIGLDHQYYLGPDIESIAREKAGVIRQGIPVICTQSEPPEALLQIARQQQARVFIRDRDFSIDQTSTDDESLFRYSFRGQTLLVSRPAMAGGHQLDNLAAALTALLVLNPACADHADRISAAIRACNVTGRLQKVAVSPTILLDVGHNHLAAVVIAEHLQKAGCTNVRCVIAMLRDKPAETVAMALEPVCKHWYCSPSPGQRGQSGEDLASRIQSAAPTASIRHFNSVEESLRTALMDSAADETLLVFGSFTTVSAAYQWLRNHIKHELHDAAKLTR